MSNSYVKRGYDYYRREAFNTIRTNIELCGDDVKVILLTSYTANEGKTETSMGIAMSLAASDKKTLFIDCDLRRSNLAGRYKVNDNPEAVSSGLTGYLIGKSKIEDVIVQTKSPNLKMIFSGAFPPNPTELLSNAYFKRLIEYARENFDYVIVDAPPLGAVIDPIIISRQCDGVLLLLASGQVSAKNALNIKQQLTDAGCRILGAILNRYDYSQSEKRGAYYNYYY